MIARRAASRQIGRSFYQWPLESTEPIDRGAAFGGTPVVFHRSDSFQTFHAASFEAVSAALPTERLHPVRLPNDRAVVHIAAFQHAVVTAHGVDGLAALPYGEVMVSALVTRRPAPPLVPLFAPGWTGLAAGGFVLHLPVTTRVARDAGRIAWGYPKFVADMEFDDSVEARRVHLAEGDHTILSLLVRPSGRPTVRNGSLTLYSVLADELVELSMPTHLVQQMRWGRSAGHLELGDHEVADELRGLSIEPQPFFAIQTMGQRLAMAKGRSLGTAQPYLGYVGEERDLGRYVVRYPNTAPIDQYASFAATASSSHGAAP